MRRSGTRAAFVSVVTLGTVLALVLPSEAAIRLDLVSQRSDGTPANGHSEGGSLSARGNLVVFGSHAANLPGGDGSTFQVYLRNFSTGKTTLLSRKRNGDPVDESVYVPFISANGRFVVFYGQGVGLPGGSTDSYQVWIKDLLTGRTRLVSKARNGAPGEDSSESRDPSVSADGRFVSFVSDATNLPGHGDLNDPRVYVRDTERDKTIVVSKTNSGAAAQGHVSGQTISSDGRYVVFESRDADLPGGDGSTEHVYLRDLERRRTVLIAEGGAPTISGNGRFIVFTSSDLALPGGDGTDFQVYIRDRERRTTRLVSRNSAGDPQDGDSLSGQASSDGRYVTFDALASNLPGGDGTTDQVYIRDMKRRTTRLLSRTDQGDAGDDHSDTPSISANGRFVAFVSHADNLGGDPNYINSFRSGPIG